MSTTATAAMTENDVVTAVANHLRAEGWTIESACTTKEQGVDLVAQRSGTHLYVEAKGATSSKSSSRRYGQPFSRSQVFDHVAKAVYTTLSLLASSPKAKAALALPDDQVHRHFVGLVAPLLNRVGVDVYFVGLNSVRVEHALG